MPRSRSGLHGGALSGLPSPAPRRRRRSNSRGASRSPKRRRASPSPRRHRAQSLSPPPVPRLPNPSPARLELPRAPVHPEPTNQNVSAWFFELPGSLLYSEDRAKENLMLWAAAHDIHQASCPQLTKVVERLVSLPWLSTVGAGSPIDPPCRPNLYGSSCATTNGERTCAR